MQQTLISPNTRNWRNPSLVGRIPELDGIRGVAILLVLVWHYFAQSQRGGALGSWLAYLLAALRLTWTGVDLFFVLSGFLIGGILYDAKNSSNYYRTFYFRRIFRIFPLYFIWVAVFALGLFFVGDQNSGPFREVFNRVLPVWSYPLFLQNFFMASRQTFGAEWLGVTWSLAVEEQFYFLLPSLVHRLSYRGIVILAAASIIIAPIVRLSLALSGDLYWGTYTLLFSRMDALGFGVLVAMVCRNREAWEWLVSRRRIVYAAFLLLGCGFLLQLRFQRPQYTIGLTCIGAFYAVLLLLTIMHLGSSGTKIFRSRVLVNLGTVAYAVYIFHGPVNTLLHFAFFGSGPPGSSLSSLAVSLFSLAIVMLLAALSWRVLEKPLIRHAHAAYHY